MLEYSNNGSWKKHLSGRLLFVAANRLRTHHGKNSSWAVCSKALLSHDISDVLAKTWQKESAQLCFKTVLAKNPKRSKARFPSYSLHILFKRATKAIFWSSAACLSIPCIPSFSLIVFVSTVFVAKYAHHSRYLLQSHSPRSKRHKQVVSSNGAKYYQTGQAYASLRTVWKWQERNAKLMQGSCSIQSSSVRTSSNHSVFCRLLQKKQKVSVCQVSLGISHKFNVPKLNSDITSGSAVAANMRSSTKQTMEAKVRSTIRFAQSQTF